MDASNLPDIGLLWKRPQNVKFPSVWHWFETRPNDNGTTYKVRVEEVTPDRFEEVIEFMTKFYFTDEPLSVSSRLLEDELSVAIYQYVLMTALQQGVSIIAVLDEDTPKPQMIGLQILSIASENDPPLPEVPGDAINKFKQLLFDVRQACNPFAVLKDKVYLADWGLVVDPAFRGMNVGHNILASLEKVAKAFGVRGIFTLFTRIESQVLATRLGFRMYHELVYDEYKDENGDKIFPVTGHKSLKCMGIVYE